MCIMNLNPTCYFVSVDRYLLVNNKLYNQPQRTQRGDLKAPIHQYLQPHESEMSKQPLRLNILSIPTPDTTNTNANIYHTLT